MIPSLAVGALELGGTKCRAAIVGTKNRILAQKRVATTSPEETLGPLLDFLANDDIRACGVASFGPLHVRQDSENYGHIAATPKPGWSNTPVLATVRSRLKVPTAFATDTEAAAVAEYHFGAGSNENCVGYITIGTGVGVGIALGDSLFRGRDHLELGHIPVSRVSGDVFPSLCRFHDNCLEGLASGPAMHKRWGVDASEIPLDHKAWDIQARYIAQLIRVLVYSFCPDVITLGGGVGGREGFAQMVNEAALESLAGYSPSHANNTSLVLSTPLGQDAGLLGAAYLANSLVPQTPPLRDDPREDN